MEINTAPKIRQNIEKKVPRLRPIMRLTPTSGSRKISQTILAIAYSMKNSPAICPAGGFDFRKRYCRIAKIKIPSANAS